MSKKDLYQETIKTMLAGIKIAWQADKRLWQKIVLDHNFWEKISQQLEEIANWNTNDDKIVAKIVAEFKNQTANLSSEEKIKKLAEVLRGGWKITKAQTSLRYKIEAGLNRLKEKWHRK